MAEASVFSIGGSLFGIIDMDIGHRVLFRNTILNLIGLVIPLLVGFVTIPLVVRGLGNDRFGVLTLVWVVFGYFGMFDLGLGRTTTRYIADALGRDENEKLSPYLWTTVILQTGIGLVAAAVMHLVSPLLVRRFLNIPEGFIAETILTLRLVGWSLPVMFLSSSFRGVLEAVQRFDLVNAVKIPVNILFYGLPLAGVALGYRLPGIVLLLILSRIGALLSWAALSMRIMPVLRTKPIFHASLVRSLFSYSGWLGLSGILYSITSSLDRLVIGSVITVEAVTFYSAPLEAISRIGVIPGSLSMVLFPAFSLLDGGKKRQQSETLFARSTKFLLISTGPIFLLLIFFAGDFLRLWLGAEFAVRSTLVVQMFAASFLVYSILAVPNNYLLGIGRVDIAPKYQAAELVVFAAMAWVGAKAWGIKGVAAASGLRLVAFTIFLYVASFKTGRLSFRFVWRHGFLKVVQGLAVMGLGLVVNAALGFGLWGGAVLSLAFAVAAWGILLDRDEREFFLSMLRIRRSVAEARASRSEGQDSAVETSSAREF